MVGILNWVIPKWSSISYEKSKEIISYRNTSICKRLLTYGYSYGGWHHTDGCVPLTSSLG